MANALFFALFFIFIKSGYPGETGQLVRLEDIRGNIFGSAILSDTEFLITLEGLVQNGGD
jgi:hypothetical protein